MRSNFIKAANVQQFLVKLRYSTAVISVQMCCRLRLIRTTGYKVSLCLARLLRYLDTHVPRTSLKSKMFLISSTCFFQDPSLHSPFSFAMSHRGGGRFTGDVGGSSVSHPAPKRKKSSALPSEGFLFVRLCCVRCPCMQQGKPRVER